jgi:hypothetical protein
MAVRNSRFSEFIRQTLNLCEGYSSKSLILQVKDNERKTQRGSVTTGSEHYDHWDRRRIRGHSIEVDTLEVGWEP